MTIPKIAQYELPAINELPNNKVNWQFDISRAALLIHDMQQYFIDFYGTDNLTINQVISNIKKIKNFCHQQQIPVFYTAQPVEQSIEQRALLNDMWSAGLTQQPDKQSIITTLMPDADDVVLEKWRYSAFQRCDFEQRLQVLGRNQLLICGVYANIGCITTAVDAFMRDIKPFMLADAVADFSRAEHFNALNYLATKVGVVTHTKQILATN